MHWRDIAAGKDAADPEPIALDESHAAALWLAASLLAWAGGVGGRMLLWTLRDDWVSVISLLAAPAIVQHTAMLPIWFHIDTAHRFFVALEVLSAIGWAASLWTFGFARRESIDRGKLAPLLQYGGFALLLAGIALHILPLLVSNDIFISLGRLIYPLEAALAIILAVHLRRILPVRAAQRSLIEIALWIGGIWLAADVLSLLAEDGEASLRIFIGQQLASGAGGIVWAIIMAQLWLAPRVNPPAG